MTQRELVVDALLRAGSDDRILVPPDGAFARAMRAMAERGDHLSIPDRVVLGLYAYEIVERMREWSDDPRSWVVPFWPDAAFDAADVDAHAGAELMRMWPPALPIRYRVASALEVAATSKDMFGALRFDPFAYGSKVLSHLCSDPRSTHVAGAMFVCDGAILLERRPDDAHCYAGMWDTPGGHLECGEDGNVAIRRELAEELGVTDTDATPIAVVDDRDPTSGGRYRHHVFVVTSFRGEITSRDQRTLRWQAIAGLPDASDVNAVVRRLASELQSRPSVR